VGRSKPASDQVPGERYYLLGGIAAGTAWFWKNDQLPVFFKGLVQGDSVDYVQLASRLNTPLKLFTYIERRPPGIADRTPGYPIFLSLHKLFVDLFNLDWLVDWIELSLWGALALHFAAGFFLYRSVRHAGFKLHPAALLLLLAHPGLTSHAAIVMSDGFTASITMLAAGCMLRLGKAESRKELGIAVLAGGLFGLAVLARPSYHVAVLLFLLIWCALSLLRPNGKENQKKNTKAKKSMAWKERFITVFRPALAPLLATVTCLGVVFPLYYSCNRAYGEFCLQRPDMIKSSMTENLGYAMGGARMYTMLLRWHNVNGVIYDLGTKLNRPGNILVTDDFFQEHFGDHCPIREATIVSDLLGCYSRNLVYLPVYFGKKTIGFFDNYHLNSYATFITSGKDIFYNRIFGAMGFMGFVAMLYFLGLGVLEKKWRSPWFLALVFPTLFVGFSIVLHIVSRYGLPMAPYGIVGFVLAVQLIAAAGWERRKWQVGALVIAGLLFLIQVRAWDAVDPMKYEELSESSSSVHSYPWANPS
jgi:hypothetical protein